MGLDTSLRNAVKEAIRDEIRNVIREELGARTHEPVEPRVVSVLSVREAAQLLQVDHKTVRKWIRLGSLKALQHGRVLRIRRDDLDEFCRTAYGAPKAPEASINEEAARILKIARRRTG
jgi:excisionase family DNA binding protein